MKIVYHKNPMFRSLEVTLNGERLPSFYAADEENRTVVVPAPRPFGTERQIAKTTSGYLEQTLTGEVHISMPSIRQLEWIERGMPPCLEATCPGLILSCDMSECPLDPICIRCRAQYKRNDVPLLRRKVYSCFDC